jgi:SAM-dependent methyltransferase
LYAWKNNIDYYYFEHDFKKSGHVFMENFIQKAQRKDKLLPLIREKILKIDSSEINFETKQRKVYDLEYGEFHYEFLNALLVDSIFESIVGIPKDQLHFLLVLDVGAGSGELEGFLINAGCSHSSIFCIDTSSASIARLNTMGIRGYTGTLGEANIENNSFDLTFLSYFIEYDTAQSDTFLNAVNITNPGGKIILEAFLPAHIRFTTNEKTISRGLFLIDDIDKIKKNFFMHANKLNKRCTLEKISIGYRWVYSHYGLCKLPSVFLTFTI